MGVDLTIYSSFRWEWNAYFTRTYILNKKVFRHSLWKSSGGGSGGVQILAGQPWALSAHRLFYSSLFTHVWTVAKWNLVYWKRAYWHLVPMWVQFTYLCREGCCFPLSLMDSSVQNQIITQPLPGVAAQISHPWYKFTAITSSFVQCCCIEMHM